jgi:hypothetical protein
MRLILETVFCTEKRKRAIIYTFDQFSLQKCKAIFRDKNRYALLNIFFFILRSVKEILFLYNKSNIYNNIFLIFSRRRFLLVISK